MTDVDKYGERIAELENDRSSIQNTSERLIKLESTTVSDGAVIKEHNAALANISEHLSQMGSDSTISYRLSDLEINRMSDFSMIQSLNDTVTILAKQVAKGKTNGTTNTVQNISEILSEIQLETMTCASVIQDHNTTLSYQSNRIAELASIRLEVQNNTDRINEINLNRKSNKTLVQKYNDTKTDLGNRKTSLEPDKTIIKGNSKAINKLIMNEKERNVTFTEHEKRIAELETGLSLALNTTDMITILHNRSLKDLGDRLVALEPYCSMAINNSARLDEFQLDRQADKSLIQEHNSNLQSVQSRLTTAEGKMN